MNKLQQDDPVKKIVDDTGMTRGIVYRIKNKLVSNYKNKEG